MTQDEIIRMAREAGFEYAVDNERWYRFAALVAAHTLENYADLTIAYMKGVSDGAAHEREACAKVVETDGLNLCEGDKDMQRMYIMNKVWRDHYAAAIRARSE